MRIERRYSMDALAEILHDEEIRNGRDAVPPIVSMTVQLDAETIALIVVFDDDDVDE